MPKTSKRRHLADAHSFPGFRAGSITHGRFGDPQMRVVTLARRTKNVLWGVRHDASQLLRPNAASGAGLVERTVPRSAGHRGSSDSMPSVSRGEARAIGVPGRQSVLHPTLCVLRWPALSL